ncbi:MAG TPA: thermonuclease family protein [Candidatus Nanoarchaeia archaeon]|nr:thermonuclease family protein [Candidatus Nanoarchaeia archaeon]
MDELEPIKPLRRFPRRRHISLAGLILLLIGALVAGKTYPEKLTGAATTIQNHQPGLYPVKQVVDGDTIEVDSNGKTETVRLIGMDTPETKDPRKPVQCFGETAHQKTESLVGGKSVRLEADPLDSDRDKYHRLLRYVYLPDGTFVNMELVKQGYAFAYTIFPNSKLEGFKAAELQAREQNLGLWAGCNVDESKDIKQTAGAKS